jgi:hypothetical protein
MNIVPGVVHSKTKIDLHCKGVESLEDSLNYGFSYIEHKDHIVEYIVANSALMKRIFGEVRDSVLKLESGSIGELWTARLFLSDRLSDKEIFFSNSIFSVVINLNLNPNPNLNLKEVEDADIRISL